MNHIVKYIYNVLHNPYYKIKKNREINKYCNCHTIKENELDKDSEYWIICKKCHIYSNRYDSI